MAQIRAAVLDEAGTVVTVALVEEGSDWEPGEGLRLRGLPDGSLVGPGWSWDGLRWSGGTVSEPEPEAPAVDPALVDAWQDATTIAQLRAAGVALFAALGVTT